MFGPTVGSEPPPDLSDVLPPDGALADPSPRFATVGAVGGGPQYRVLIEGVPNGGAIAFAQSLHATEHTFRQIVTVEVIAFLTVLLTLCMMAWWLLHHGVRPDREDGQDRERDRGRRPLTTGGAGGGQDRGRPARHRAEHDARADRGCVRREAGVGGPPPSLRRGRLSRAAHAVDVDPRLCGALAGGCDLDRARAGRRDAPGRARGGADGTARRRHAVARAARRGSSARPDRRRPGAHRRGRGARRPAAVEPGRPISLVADDSVVVSGDADRLRQVCANLLANALVHTPPGTPVEVRLHRDGPAAVLEVADHGPGLPPELVARVFERFVRADPARTRATGGSGLGLAIVAAVVEAHGGRAEVDSEPGEGATFRVVLPAQVVDVPSASSDHAVR